MRVILTIAALAALALFLAAPVTAVPPQGGPWYHCSVDVNNGAAAGCTYSGYTVGGGASCGTTQCTSLVLHCGFGNGPGPTYAPRCD